MTIEYDGTTRWAVIADPLRAGDSRLVLDDQDATTVAVFGAECRRTGAQLYGTGNAQRAAICVNALRNVQSPHGVVMAGRNLATSIRALADRDPLSLPQSIVDALAEWDDILDPEGLVDAQ